MIVLYYIEKEGHLCSQAFNDSSDYREIWDFVKTLGPFYAQMHLYSSCHQRIEHQQGLCCYTRLYLLARSRMSPQQWRHLRIQRLTSCERKKSSSKTFAVNSASFVLKKN